MILALARSLAYNAALPCIRMMGGPKGFCLPLLAAQAERDTLSERMQLLQQQFHTQGLQQAPIARQASSSMP